jgi:hypothetical protein
MGAIGVIIGLYIVLWGKVEDLVDVKENVEPLLEDEFIVHIIE